MSRILCALLLVGCSNTPIVVTPALVNAERPLLAPTPLATETCARFSAFRDGLPMAGETCCYRIGRFSSCSTGYRITAFGDIGHPYP